MENLFRRQFVMGNIGANNLPESFVKEKLADNFYIYQHKDLNFIRTYRPGRSLILLGFIIDPYNYKASDEEILENIIDNTYDFKTLLKKTVSLGGRWAIIYKDQNEINILTDPSGLRQVCYSLDEKIVGSNPAIINYIKNHDLRDDRDFKTYVNSKFYRINEMEWYGNDTFFKSIKKLLPNSYLDLNNFKTWHFWVDVDKKSYANNIKTVSNLLVKELRAIEKRKGVKVQSLTSGYDSRVIFAASEAASCDFDFFLSTMNTMDLDHADIKIAQKILAAYGKKLTIIDNLEPLEDDFIKLLENSVTGTQILPKTLTIQHFYKKDDDFIHVSGNNSAVFKSYYKKSTARDGKDVAKLVGLPRNLRIFNDEFDAWLKERKVFANENDIDLMKLFYWEMRMPNWGVQYQQEADLAMEEFAPFNNREIILRLLEMSKNKPYSEVFDDIINYFDPKLLTFPINPRSKKEKVKDFIKSKVSKRSWERIKLIVKN